MGKAVTIIQSREQFPLLGGVGVVRGFGDPGLGVGASHGAGVGNFPVPVIDPVTPVVELLHFGAKQQDGSRGSGTMVHPGLTLGYLGHLKNKMLIMLLK